MKLKKLDIILIFILLVGGFLRFYKLNWGQGLFTHPDEYHIAASVMQLHFPEQMHPHFFSYGTVTIYLIYFTMLLLQFLTPHLSIFNFQFSIFNSLLNPFLIGRFYSALFSTLTILLVYSICRGLFPKQTYLAVLATALVAITPGVIQQAHFATPESNLIFFLMGSLLFSLKFVHQKQLHYLVLASIFFGFALGVKVSAVIFFPVLIMAAIITNYQSMLAIAPKLLLILTIPLATLRMVAPYIFLDFPSFWGNVQYEGNLAAGNLAVFYTRQFINTTPFLFQIEKIFPYALGPTILIFGGLGLLVLIIESVRKRNPGYWLLIISFLTLFLPNAFLFAKWTRFISPTFPFFAIFAAFLVEQLKLPKLLKSLRLLTLILNSIFLILTFPWSLSFFSIYLRPDVRITASSWLAQNTPPESKFLVEGGNMVDLPLEGDFKRVSLDFYALEDDPLTRFKIASALLESDYFLVQSRRVFLNHQRLADKFPKTAKFYDSLFSGKLGFEEIKEFHSYPTLPIVGLEIPDESAEETWSVFDHPVIRVFKKTKQLSTEQYSEFLQ